MRYLYLTRGLPGCGKSTFLRQRLPNPSYIISPDDIRMQYAQTKLNPDGTETISQANDKAVWKQLMVLVEQRMMNGDTTFIDATHINLDSIKKYKALCEQYRYSINVIDFSDVDVSVCKQRNMSRESYKYVPEEVIDRMNETLLKNPVSSFPSYINVLKKDDVNFSFKPVDFSKYAKVVVLGDIHGCFAPLKEYFDNEPISEDNAYIFVGDYLDRGIQNKEVLEFCIAHCEDKNFFFLEGNHEKWVKMYSKNGELEGIMNKDFVNLTSKEIADIDIADIRKLVRKLRTFMYIGMHSSWYVITHGGICTLPNILLNEKNYTCGIGKYEDSELCDKTFISNVPEGVVSIHGHRNIHEVEINNTERTYNLEDKIEFGGNLRIVEIVNKNIFAEVNTKAIKNTVFRNEDEPKEMISRLKESALINMKDLGNDVCSFNFTRSAFRGRAWDKTTVRARGLFMDVKKQTIIARSYDKFFNLYEMKETSEKELKNNLVFPVVAYKKANGFLGIVSSNKGELFVTSKSTNIGNHKEYFNTLLLEALGSNVEAFRQHLEKNNLSAIFECIDIKNDPHIIKYDKSSVVLLDLIHNEFTAKPESYEEMKVVANMFNLEYKEKSVICNNWEELSTLMRKYDNQEDPDSQIEGFVFVDMKNFMFKYKTPFYSFWKRCRFLRDMVLAEKEIDKNNVGKKERVVYEFMKNIDKEDLEKYSIIDIRDKFLNETA